MPRAAHNGSGDRVASSAYLASRACLFHHRRLTSAIKRRQRKVGIIGEGTPILTQLVREYVAVRMRQRYIVDCSWPVSQAAKCFHREYGSF